LSSSLERWILKGNRCRFDFTDHRQHMSKGNHAQGPRYRKDRAAASTILSIFPMIKWKTTPPIAPPKPASPSTNPTT
jgi:hypothetical protein